MERRDAECFSKWLLVTRETEKQRQKNRSAIQEEFKALGTGGDEDPEAWEQWFIYVGWLADERPDDLEYDAIDRDESDDDGNDDNEEP